MAHLQILQMSDEEDQSAFTTSFSTTMDSSQEDVKPDLTLLGQVVSAPPGSHTMEDDDSCEDDPFSPQPSTQPDTEKKKSKKGSKRGGIKGLKQGAAGDDSFTITTLSAGRGQKKLQAAHLTSSLLEEVLNEKKMALLKSPDVIEQLQLLQEDVRVNRQQQQHSQEKGKAGPSRADSKSRDREARPSRQSQPTENSSGRQSNQSTTTASSSSCASSGAGGSSSSTSSIWSKEGSAFTSVAATTLPGSNQDT